MEAAPIVYLGPSLPPGEAEKFISAEFRPPVKRGDLERLPEGSTVAIIDGVFDQSLSISPTEIRNAVLRGVRVLGCSSMGALRAAEVPEMEGFGRVFAMFRDGIIEDDDEVALTFDPESLRPTSEPMVNIRYAVEQLRAPGTIDHSTATAIVLAAKRLHYRDRVYPLILRKAGLSAKKDSDTLLALLKSHDLKREDAIWLLENLPTLPGRAKPLPGQGRQSYGPHSRDHHSAVTLPAQFPGNASVFLWEYGERIPFEELMLFLKMTGEFPALARRALARHCLAGNLVEASFEAGPDPQAHADAFVFQTRRTWNWESAEEMRVTLRDLGVGEKDYHGWLEDETAAELTLMGLARANAPELLKAIRAELLFDDLALKRAAVRWASVSSLAEAGRRRGGRDLASAEIAASRMALCQRVDSRDWNVAVKTLAWWGVSKVQADAFAETLASARREGASMLAAMYSGASGRSPGFDQAARVLGLKPRLKPRGEHRFSSDLRRSLRWAQKLRPLVGITRVAVITGLDVVGLPNANAYRPTGTWSSTIGSGKSTTITGAKAGAIMEEVEKWAQERFPDPTDLERLPEASFQEFRKHHRCIDPATLDLPHDSCYRPDFPLRWLECNDLIGGKPIHAPAAAFSSRREARDIFFSPWLGRVVRSTSGLASGFTLEEALVHGICELIERHANVTDEALQGNPGGPRQHSPRVVDPDTYPVSTRRIASKLSRAGEVRLLELTTEVRVPTFRCVVQMQAPSNADRFASDLRRASGYACHPDPEVAMNMALLEASQSIVVPIAGGREDLTLYARSLGRHQRTRAKNRRAQLDLGTAEPHWIPFEPSKGFRSRDVREDLRWVVDRLWDAGLRNVLVGDLSRPDIAPARVVRTVVPGLQTTSSVSTSLRLRALLVEDLLPRVRGVPN